MPASSSGLCDEEREKMLLSASECLRKLGALADNADACMVICFTCASIIRCRCAVRPRTYAHAT